MRNVDPLSFFVSLSLSPIANFAAPKKRSSMSCALLARGSFEIKSRSYVHLSKSFRKSALN